MDNNRDIYCYANRGDQFRKKVSAPTPWYENLCDVSIFLHARPNLCISQFQAWPSPRAIPGDSHILVALGSGFRSSVLPGSLLPGGLTSKLKFDNFESSDIFKIILKDNFDNFGAPIYTITNMQRIRIYPDKLKSFLVKISPDPGRQHGKHAKENQTLSTFLTTENLCGLPCSHECKYGAYSDLASYAVNLAG